MALSHEGHVSLYSIKVYLYYTMFIYNVHITVRNYETVSICQYTNRRTQTHYRNNWVDLINYKTAQRPQ